MEDLPNRKIAVSVIIPFRNRAAMLRECVLTVLDSRDYPVQVILVDDCSDDQNSKTIRDFTNGYDNIQLIRLNRNVGPALARNLGARYALGKYIAFIDSDAAVDPDWLKGAIPLFEENNKVGAIQCKILMKDNRTLLDYAGDYLGRNGFLIQRAKLGDPERNIADVPVKIFAAKSAGMIVRADVFRAVGGFDSQYFIYMEETDLCWRIWLHGFVVIYAPGSRVYHTHSTTSEESSMGKYFSKYHGTKNYVTTLLKNLGSSNLMVILPEHLLLWLGIIIWHVATRRFHDGALILRGLCYNVLHLRDILAKRIFVQRNVRRLPDSAFFPIICRRAPIHYFYDKLAGPLSGWNR